MGRWTSRRFRRAVVVLSATVGLVVGSLGLTSAGASTHAAKKGGFDPNGTLKFGLELNNRSPQLVAFDPSTSTTTNDVWNLSFIYDTLLYPPLKTGKYEPALAASYQVVDNSTIEVTLRPNLTFQDGEKLDADAVKASIMRNLATNNPSWNPAFKTLDSVEALSPTKFRFHLKADAYAFLPLLAARETMVVSPKAAAAGTLEKHPVGAGPFEFKEYQPEQLLTMTRYKNYWNVKNVHIGEIDMVSTITGPPRVNSLLTDQVDAAGINVPDVGGVKGRDDIKVTTKAGDSFIYTQVCKNKAPFDKVEVRKAFSLAINRDELNQAAFQGLGKPAYMAWAEGTPYYVAALAKQQKYNPKLAKQLLAKAGYKKGFSINTAIVEGYAPTETMATVLKAQLAKVGINLDIKVVGAAGFAQEVWIEKRFDTATVPWVRSGVENTVMFADGFQANLCDYHSDQLNALRGKILATPPGTPELKTLWAKWEKMVADNALVTYQLFPANVVAFHSKRVDGNFQTLYAGPSAQFLDWTAFRVKKT